MRPGVTLSAPLGTIKRTDGSLQLAYNGYPHYTHAQGTNTTTAGGDGLNVTGGLWHLAQSTGLTSVLAPATPASGPTSTFQTADGWRIAAIVPLQDTQLK